MKVIEKRSRTKQTKQPGSKVPVDAAAALRARIEAATVPALRTVLSQELPKIARELVYRKIGIEADSWGRYRVVALSKDLQGLVDAVAKEAAETIAKEVDTFEIGAAEMREVRLAYASRLKAEVMDRALEVAKERAEAVAEEIVERAIAGCEERK